MYSAKVAVAGRAAGVVFAALIAFGAAPVEALDWPQWRGPDRNGISKETGWKSDWPGGRLDRLWSAEIGTGFSSVVTGDGKVYGMGNAGDRDTVFCFDAETGKEIWKHSYAQKLDPKYYEGGTLASPTLAGGKVFTLSKDGKTFCLDAGTGDVVWSKDLAEDLGIQRSTWGFSGSPLILGDMVILNAGDMGLALSRADGSVVWQNGKGPCGYATLVPYEAGGKPCLALFGSKDIAGLETATGKELWRHEWKTKHLVNAADPIIDGDRIFISSGYDEGCALLELTGNTVREVWKNGNMHNKMNPSVLWKGHIYGVDEEGELRCLDLETGAVAWAREGFGQGSLMLADGKLIVLGDKGRLVVAKASPTGYEELSSAEILTGKCWTVPVLSNGRIYTRNAKGKMVCVDVK